MRWYIGRTIKKICDSECADVDLVNRVGESIRKKFRLVNYHSDKSKSSLYTSFPDNAWKADNLASAYIGQWAAWSSHSEEVIDNAARNVFESEAHIESFASQLHSIADNLSHLIYLAIPSLQEKITYPTQVSIYKIRGCLTHSDEVLKSEIEFLEGMYEFNYLAAFTNLGKHQSLVERNFHCNFEDNEEHPHQIAFKDFTYKGVEFKAIKASEFTDTYGAKVKEQYLRIGAALEQLLSTG